MAPTARGTMVRVDELAPRQVGGYLEGYPTALRYKASVSSRAPQGGETLAELDEWYQALPHLASLNDLASSIHDKPSLVRLMRWKLAREKHRPMLLSLIASNPPAVCTEVLRRAAERLLSHHTLSLSSSSSFPASELLNAVQATMKILAELRGVGPATASAIVAAWVPHGIFQSDELALNLLGTHTKIEYTWPFYKRFYADAVQCLQRVSSAEEHSSAAVQTGRDLERVAWCMFYSHPAAGADDKPATALPAKVGAQEPEDEGEDEDEDKVSKAAGGKAGKRKTKQLKVELAETSQPASARTRRTSKRTRQADPASYGEGKGNVA